MEIKKIIDKALNEGLLNEDIANHAIGGGFAQVYDGVYKVILKTFETTEDKEGKVLQKIVFKIIEDYILERNLNILVFYNVKITKNDTINKRNEQNIAKIINYTCGLENYSNTNDTLNQPLYIKVKKNGAFLNVIDIFQNEPSDYELATEKNVYFENNKNNSFANKKTSDEILDDEIPF